MVSIHSGLFFYFFASPTSPWLRSRVLTWLTTSVMPTSSSLRMAQFFAVSGLKLSSIETAFFSFHYQAFLARPCALSPPLCSILPGFLLQPLLPSSISCVTAPYVPWLTPSSPTQSSHSYPRLVYAPLIFHPTASDGLVSPLPFRLGYWSASFSSTATAALTPLVPSSQSPNSGCWLDGRWPFWTLTLFGISDVNFDLFSFYLALSAFSVAFDFRCVMFSLHHALRLRS